MEIENPVISTEKFSATCADGVVLQGILLIPDSPKAVVQFNCGTATKKEFYLPFLTYLAEHGFICCLWDYRGSGDSAPADMKNCLFTFRDYGIQDMPAIKRFLEAKFPSLPFLLVGHSAGGQQTGFMDQLESVKGMVNFAVSTGYLPYMPLTYRLKSNYFFYVFTPLSILFTGYLKAKNFRIMEDLPRNVVREWRDWCEKETYLFDPKFYGKTVPKGHFQEYTFPIHTFWTADDTISNERNTQNYWKNVKGTKPITFEQLRPADFGLKAIGHFGFFKKSMQETLWPLVLDRLEGFLSDEN